MKKVDNLIDFIKIINKREKVESETFYENLIMTKEESDIMEKLIPVLHKYSLEKGKSELVKNLLEMSFMLCINIKLC